MAYLGVKLKINESLMSVSDLRRLNQILYRDTRIIESYTNIINENEKSIEKGNKINKSELDKLTATTEDRTVVKHDLKSRYSRISLNEMKECRDTAVEMYNSYLSLKDDGGNRPNVTGLIPCSIGYRRFNLDIDNSLVSIMDSMDTNPKMIREGKSRPRHDKLVIPIILSKYALDKFNEGTIKAVKIFYQNNVLIKNFKLTQFSKIGKNGLGKYLPVTPSKIRKGNGKVRHRPNARKRSPVPMGQTGTKLSDWFQHDLSVSTETLSSEKVGTGEAGHSNRPSGQHTRKTKGVTPEVTVTSG